MNLPLRIARRYLFAKKSTNAINIITGIAMFGLSVGTAALILVLSVFNGFEDLITSMYSNFNPDLKITPERGKTFTLTEAQLEQLQQVEGVQYYSRSLEEVAFFQYRDKQDFGIIKGVDSAYALVTNIQAALTEGRYRIDDPEISTALMGLGMRNKLGVDVDNLIMGLRVYMPKQKQTGPFEQPFRSRTIQPTGTFVLQQEFDNQYVISSLEFTQGLMGKRGEISALEMRLKKGWRPEQVKDDIRAVLGPDFEVKDRYEQEEAFMKLMRIEKWMSFAIVSLMLLLVAFNIIGALWMIVLEKKKDLAILKSMGALDTTVRNIFLYEGGLMSLLGLLVGFGLALLLVLLQKQFNLISIPGSFVVSAYPISLRLVDFVVVAITVFGIGMLASVAPALRAKRVSALIREE